MTEHARTLDILVIGAGQAGLALGFHLKKTPFRFQLVERNARVGDSWRKRYASLVLFTPRAYSALPGLAMPGDPDVFPTKDEIGDYLETYANHFDLPVVLGTGIRRLERVDGSFRVITEAGEPIDSRAVVLATGAFQRPAIPSISRGLSAEVTQLAPEDYKAPSQLSPGTVLVVGDGATGRQIALELAAAHEVLLAAGRPRRVSPDRILGKSVFWWMDKLGILRASRESAIGRYLMKADPFPGKSLELQRLRRQGVDVVGRVVQAEGKKVSFADGRRQKWMPCSGRPVTKTTPTGWRFPRPRTRTVISSTSVGFLPSRTCTSLDEAGSGHADRPCLPGLAQTPRT
jgi:putative flavoprotein involved in K+ transport